jgi:thiol-disulfide isomerase/thioredoxin
MAFIPGPVPSSSARRDVRGRALCPDRGREFRTLRLSRPAGPPRMTVATSAPVSPPAERPRELFEPVLPVSGTQEFLTALETNADRLAVFKVYAPWCRSCKALEPKVRRLAREFDDVSFFDMDYEDEENKAVCFRLGVSSMPTFLFYYGAAGLVDKFTCGPARADMLRAKIQQYTDGECSLPATE